MPLRDLLQEGCFFALESYRKPKAGTRLHQTHVAFSGSPYTHPYDETKVLLVSDPYSTNTHYYEFHATDISFVEELPSIVTPEGRVLLFVRLWVKKGCRATRCTPFVVTDLR
jgi:inorganic pyrophosphatase